MLSIGYRKMGILRGAISRLLGAQERASTYFLLLIRSFYRIPDLLHVQLRLEHILKLVMPSVTYPLRQ